METTPHRWKIIVGISVAALIIGLYLFIPPVWQLNGGSVMVTQWRRATGRQMVLVGPKRENWVRASAVSKHVLHAIIASEDANFYSHHGLDFAQIQESVRKNFSKGRYVRGASTITQQVVKMAFLSRDKTLIRKAREAVGALLLEFTLSKTKILEWYINLAEFGDGVYGIKASAWHYFRTKPELITIQQAVHLALVLPSPNAWSKGLRSRSLTPFGHVRYAQIVNHMKLSNYVTQDQWLNTLATGDFGRPVASYNDILAKLNSGADIDSSLQADEVEISQEEPADDAQPRPLDAQGP